MPVTTTKLAIARLQKFGLSIIYIKVIDIS